MRYNTVLLQVVLSWLNYISFRFNFIKGFLHEILQQFQQALMKLDFDKQQRKTRM